VVLSLLTAILTVTAQNTSVHPAAAATSGSTGTTTVAPNADGTTTNWSKGGTCTAGSFYTCVNDYADSGGASYIETTSSAQASVNFTLDLANMPSDFRAATGVTVDLYAQHNNASPNGGVDVQKVGVDLVNGSTLITNQPADQTLTTSMAPYTFNLSPLAWNDKTTWDGAKLRVYGKWTVTGTTDGTTKVRVASAQVDITYLTTTGYLTQQKYILVGRQQHANGGSQHGDHQCEKR
jgi:hypothetical protein